MGVLSARLVTYAVEHLGCATVVFTITFWPVVLLMAFIKYLNDTENSIVPKPIKDFFRLED